MNIVQGTYHQNPKEVGFLFRFNHLFSYHGGGGQLSSVKPNVGGSAHTWGVQSITEGGGGSGSPKEIYSYAPDP